MFRPSSKKSKTRALKENVVESQFETQQEQRTIDTNKRNEANDKTTRKPRMARESRRLPWLGLITCRDTSRRVITLVTHGQKPPNGPVLHTRQCVVCREDSDERSERDVTKVMK